MLKRSIIILSVCLISSAAFAAYGDKFSTTSSTTDFLQQRANLGLNNQDKGPQAPILPSSPVLDTTPQTPINTIPPADLPTQETSNAPSLTETSLPPAATPPPISTLAKPEVQTFQSNLPSLEKTKITVPDFEAKYNALLAKEAEQFKAKKKRTLWESITDEFARYGIFLILGIIIFIVAYAIIKEKKEETTEESPGEGKNKNIWHEDF